MKFFDSVIAHFPYMTSTVRSQADTRRPKVGQLERLPKWLNLIPMITQWLWLGLKYGSVTLPSCANPTITSGGLIGEGKLEYFGAMGPYAHAHTATYTFVVNTAGAFKRAVENMRAAGLDFPVVMKPNAGWCGFGVRRIRNVEDMKQYLELFPADETIVIQRFVPHEGEAGIFYARFPGEARGKLIGILLRTFPHVVGDGKSSVGSLIARDERLARLGHDGLHECTHDAAYIPVMGEKIRLATIGSTRVGGLYRDGTSLITPALTQTMDRISQDIDGFHMGRYDVRYESMEKLRAGQGIHIMEVNGAGAEAVQAWDPKYSIFESYGIVFAKQRLLFAIGNAMRAKGHKPISPWALIRLHLWQQNLIKRYPPSN